MVYRYNTENKMNEKAKLEVIRDLVESQLSIPDIGSKKRFLDNVFARNLYFVLATNLTRYSSLNRIGSVVNRHHATVLHGLQKYQDVVVDSKDKRFSYLIDAYDSIYKFVLEKESKETEELEEPKFTMASFKILENRINNNIFRLNALEQKNKMLQEQINNVTREYDNRQAVEGNN